MLVEAFSEQVPTVKTCERWFQRFKSGDFDVDDKEHGKPPKRYEDAELQALLDEDDAQTQKQLAEQLEVSQQAVSNRLREKTTQKDNTRSFFSMTTLHHIRQDRFATRWKHSIGKCLRMRLTHQTWPHPITTYSLRWDTHSLSSASILTNV